MPAFSQSLETALHRALEYANERHHEYATLEHLLLSLLDDRDASAVMKACSVDLDELKARVTEYLDNELSALFVKGSTEAQPTTGFQRVIHRAVVHVQSSGREEVTGANVLVAIFAERETPCRLLPAGAGHDALRCRAVHQPRHRQAAGHVRAAARARRRRGQGRRQGRREEAAAGRAQHLLRQPQQEGQERPHRSADRARARGDAHHPGAVPPAEEQSPVRRRSRASARPPSRKGWRARSSSATSPRCCAIPPSSLSTWARCSPARAIAATSRSA